MNELLTHLVDRLLDNRIEITLCKVQGSIHYDLNTGMKSGLEIWDDDDQARWEGRYSSGIIGGWDDLIDVAANCMCVAVHLKRITMNVTGQRDQSKTS